MNRKYVAIVGVMTMLAGCATHRIETREANTAGIGETYVSSYSAGPKMPVKRVGERECPTDLIQSVEIKRNFGQRLLSALTFGAVDKMTVTYLCKNASVSGGSTDE